MYSLYKWQVDALIKGRLLAQVDERENLAELSAKLRYTLNAKTVKPKKIFDKKNEENRVNGLFSGTPKKAQQQGFAERVQAVNEHFKRKFEE